ncbi:TrbL/VirB6 plasmid conjugal transfer protein [Methylophilaceae bacterium 11]|nr:TrbL/VirB6 plasmid conjugal transfer protein [Methylophilaceae bacterium 11]
MKKIMNYCFSLFITLLSTSALANPTQIGSIDLVTESLKTAIDSIYSNISGWTIGLLSGLMLCQFVWTNFKQIVSGSDIEKVWAKLLGALFWFGICFWIMENGHTFLEGAANFILGKASSVSGGALSPTYPIAWAIELANNLLVALDQSGNGLLSSFNFFPALMTGVCCAVILVIGALIGFKIFMILMETQIVIALSPLSFALLGLDALKDQGIAPFKYLIAMAYRMIILGGVLSAMNVLGTHVDAQFLALKDISDSSVWPPIWGAIIGFSLLGFLALRSDSIAAMLASGSSNLSPGDAAASAALAGAAVGALAGAMNSATPSPSKIGQSMSDVMTKMRSNVGDSSGASNASKFNPSINDAPPPFPKDPNVSEKDLRSMAQEKGVSAVSGAPSSTPDSKSTSGNGSSASIGGESNPSSKSIGNSSLLDRLSNVNERFANDQTANVTATVNPHGQD